MFQLGALITAAGSIYSGVTSLQASEKQAEDMMIQGEIAFNEALRDASIVREEGRSFAASQSLQYIGAGVQLVGSALITIAQTKKYAEAEAEAIEAKGAAQADYASRKASLTRSGGRAALIGGIIGGVTSLIPTEG